MSIAAPCFAPTGASGAHRSNTVMREASLYCFDRCTAVEVPNVPAPIIRIVGSGVVMLFWVGLRCFGIQVGIGRASSVN
jgi:hypothetical protein